jgi:hypothetical protein
MSYMHDNHVFHGSILYMQQLYNIGVILQTFISLIHTVGYTNQRTGKRGPLDISEVGSGV